MSSKKIHKTIHTNRTTNLNSDRQTFLIYYYFYTNFSKKVAHRLQLFKNKITNQHEITSLNKRYDKISNKSALSFKVFELVAVV